MENYTGNFGFQWNKFARTQLDDESKGQSLSRLRFFAETRWPAPSLEGQNILEVGCGAGRFSKVILESTKANLFSVDYSDAVTANIRSNGALAPDRFHLFQASIYELPFPDDSFDKVFCFGVLQHTPDFDASVKSLIDKAKPGAEIAVDFYPIKGWWTKIHAKYLLRPIAKRVRHERLAHLIEANIDWLLFLHMAMHKVGLGLLTRFLPLCDITNTLPPYLTKEQRREWAILDTFDMYSPEHDHPQRISDVARMFERHGARVTFAGFEHIVDRMSAAVVRGVKNVS
jgi:SAM-dependent methyltransferase